MTKMSKIESVQRAKRLDFLLNRVLGQGPAALVARYPDDFKLDTVKGWLSARHGGLSLKGAKKIIEMFELFGVAISLEWLMQGVLPGPTPADILRVFEAQQSDESDGASRLPNKPKSTAQDETAKLAKEIQCFQANYPNALIYKVQDDGLLGYQVGEVVAGVTVTSHFENYLGQVCIVQATNGLTMLRQLHKQADDGTFTLRCDHVDASVDELVVTGVKIAQLATVLWTRKPMSS